MLLCGAEHDLHPLVYSSPEVVVEVCLTGVTTSSWLGATVHVVQDTVVALLPWLRCHPKRRVM